MRRSFLFTILLIIVPAVRAEEAVTIKFAKPSEVESFVVKYSTSESMTSKGTRVTTGPFEKKNITVHKLEFSDMAKEVSSSGKKSEWVITTAESKIDDKAIPLEIHEKTVNLAVSGQRMEFHFDKRAPNKESMECIQSYLSSSITFKILEAATDAPVKPDTEWKLDMEKVCKLINVKDLDPTQSTGTGKLVNLKKRNGRQYGTLELQWDTVKKNAQPGYKPTTESTKVVAECCIDGSAIDFQVKSTGLTKLEYESEKIKFTIVVNAETSISKTSKRLK